MRHNQRAKIGATRGEVNRKHAQRNGSGARRFVSDAVEPSVLRTEIATRGGGTQRTRGGRDNKRVHVAIKARKQQLTTLAAPLHERAHNQ